MKSVHAVPLPQWNIYVSPFTFKLTFVGSSGKNDTSNLRPMFNMGYHPAAAPFGGGGGGEGGAQQYSTKWPRGTLLAHLLYAVVHPPRNEVSSFLGVCTRGVQ